MSKRKPRVPSYCHHKASGQAVVRILHHIDLNRQATSLTINGEIRLQPDGSTWIGD
jgi:hypothetical protein